MDPAATDVLPLSSYTTPTAVLPGSSQCCTGGANAECCVWWFRLRFFMGLECCILGEGAEGPNGGSSRSYWMSGRIISCSTAGRYYQMVVDQLASRESRPSSPANLPHFKGPTTVQPACYTIKHGYRCTVYPQGKTLRQSYLEMGNSTGVEPGLSFMKTYATPVPGHNIGPLSRCPGSYYPSKAVSPWSVSPLTRYGHASLISAFWTASPAGSPLYIQLLRVALRTSSL